jgi:hypothetical protein
MSLLQQIKKLTLDDISPNWARRLRAGQTTGLEYGFMCVVGEAHGGGDYSGCDECYEAAYRIYDSVEHDLSWTKARGPLQYELDEFVAHWNQCHVTDTGPPGL